LEVDKKKNQANNMLQTHLGVESKNNDEINYQVNLAYTLFNQKQGCAKPIKGRTENRIMGDVNLHADFNSTTGIGIKGYVKNYSYNLPDNYIPDNSFMPDEEIIIREANKNYTTFSASPYLTFEGDNWNAQIGASVNAQIGGTKNFLVAPDAYFNWKPSDKFLLYLLATGGINDNSNYNIFYENRYVAPFYRIKDARSPLDGTLGIKFSLLPNTNVELFSGYKITKDEHFYIMRPILPDENIIMGQLITPQYNKAQTFKIGGSLKYAYQDIFDVGLKLTYYKWSIKETKEDRENPLFEKLLAWNKPDFTSDLSIGFKVPTIPLRFDLIYHLETGRKMFEYFTSGVKMKDIHDLSFKGNYTINETFSVFCLTNNLLFQKYDFWYGYPAQNFNIMGGLNIKF
jgi:hypothetical protein